MSTTSTPLGAAASGLTNLGGMFSNIEAPYQPNQAPAKSPMPTPGNLVTNKLTQSQAVQQAVANAGATPVATQASPLPTNTIAPTSAGTVPVTSLQPTTASGAPVTNSETTSIFGSGEGSNIDQLLGETSPTSADSSAQAIINANAPNVAQGSANLNTGLAASGISPSSSVSAIENANYGAQVQQDNLSTLAQYNLQEQGIESGLLESMMPYDAKYTADNSDWAIAGDALTGIGDVASIFANS